MNVSPTTTPVSQRIETRRSQRNLENFLNYNFNENKKLSLIQEKVHGHTVESLKELDSNDINWKTYPNLWWNSQLNLKKISHYISSQTTSWTHFIQDEPNKLVALELQCALFEKLIEKYNGTLKTKKNTQPILFNNPFKKTLRVTVSYPSVIDHPLHISRVEDIIYDRLTSTKALSQSIQNIINKPVMVLISGKETTHSKDKISYPIFVVPKNLFINTVQTPQQLFDPTDSLLRENLIELNVSYDKPDLEVLPTLLYRIGNEARDSTLVYDKGFNAGKVQGFKEAMEKVNSLFGQK